MTSNEQSRELLKDCPFCGEQPNLWTHRNQWAIDCETEDCINPGTPLCKTKEAAIEAWNTRHPPTATQEKIDWPRKRQAGHGIVSEPYGHGWNSCHDAFMKVIKERNLL